MARYRGRSGSALSAISLGVMIAVIVCAVAVARYSSVFDYVGPNMAANAMNVYSAQSGPTFGPNGQTQQSGPTPSLASQEATVHAIASAVGATSVVGLGECRANMQSPSASGRQWNGPVYVATPSLLRAYGINPSSIPSNVDVLSSRPGLAGFGVQLTYGSGNGPGPGKGPVNGPQFLGAGGNNSCSPGSCVAHPVIQAESQLPTGTSAPNTLITEIALRRLHIADQNSLGGWVHTGQRADHFGPDHQRPIAGREQPAEHRVEEQPADVGRDRELGHRVRHRARPRHPGHERGPHPKRDGE